MHRSDFVTLQAGKLKIISMLSEQDLSIKEIVEESGLSLSTVTRFIKLNEAAGDVICVSKTQRITSGDQIGTISARYIWDTDTPETQAASLISRMLDLLLDIPLRSDGIAVVRSAQEFMRRVAV